VVETAGHFPAIYLQTKDLVVDITLQVFMRKINPRKKQLIASQIKNT
jgi:hypothetical protein